MKKVILLFLILCFHFSAYTQENPHSHYQKGYVKKNGTYVQPHYKTNTNKTNHDNYSTKGNTNTYQVPTATEQKIIPLNHKIMGKTKPLKQDQGAGNIT